MALPPDDVEALRRGALLHDIGKGPAARAHVHVADASDAITGAPVARDGNQNTRWRSSHAAPDPIWTRRR